MHYTRKNKHNESLFLNNNLGVEVEEGFESINNELAYNDLRMSKQNMTSLVLMFSYFASKFFPGGRKNKFPYHFS